MAASHRQQSPQERVTYRLIDVTKCYKDMLQPGSNGHASLECHGLSAESLVMQRLSGGFFLLPLAYGGT
ncbi:Uncharacterized protein DAT39_006412 [Clarias magur]|uniref:Uncharacterized protein n=1 Tax=Clarias magur TaxID=1594786 RepID=A0A8J4UL34_CLAMG|nr:Uncharacterized protein DAT39_006412 [Clarias magur]